MALRRIIFLVFLLAISTPVVAGASGQDYAGATEEERQRMKQRQPVISPPGVPIGPIMPARQQFSIETEAKPANKPCCPTKGGSAHSE